ncbi:hypothetical protein FSARC_11281 [Fusarium sarcochroum]|uniref:F-box domain-containing protein n=1 Tax=Fusarium sarcochroum TaxID=1208366 RepID=A0A8H4X0D2_9HYPO|nr:hypothetical protein FSARC_11281 [Fusarium sarcochroum]
MCSYDSAGFSSGREDATPKPAFFGLIGHNEIFEQTRNRLSQLDGFDIKPEDAGTPGSQSNNQIRFRDLPPTIRQTCLAVLGCVFGPCYDRLISQGIRYENRLWSNITVPAVIKSLESTFGSHLDSGNVDLDRIAERICNNTVRPFQDIHTGSQKWIDQLCGPNLRWESIALLWSVLRRIPNSFEPLERAQLNFTESGTPNETVLTYLRHSITLARHFTVGNVMVLDLLFQKTIMESMIAGDASLACWASHAETVAMMTYLGVHAENDVTPYKPSLCSEFKRRLFGRIHNLDKSVVAFTGRPPLLNPHFCTTPPPLDLSDEELYAGGAVLERAVANLDPNGWNTRGGVYPSSLCKAGYLMAVILNEILGITLGSGSNATVETLRHLKQRELDVIAQLPKSLIYDSDDPSNQPLPRHDNHIYDRDLSDPPVETNVVSIRIFSRLSHLQNMFLLERLLLQYGCLDEGDVLVVSFEMITLTLLFWTHKDRFRDMRRDFEWLLMAFAVPGGGILCLELLRPTFQGRHPKDSRLSRSSIVQQLSLLVGFLDWVHPSAPNGDLCASCKIVIQRVLDYHLNDPTNNVGSLDHFSSGLAGRLNFKFELLNTLFPDFHLCFLPLPTWRFLPPFSFVGSRAISHVRATFPPPIYICIFISCDRKSLRAPPRFPHSGFFMRCNGPRITTSLSLYLLNNINLSLPSAVMADPYTTPSLGTMPAEILSMIGSNLSGNELGSIAQTSRRFRQVFLSRLFETIKFSGNLGLLTEQLTSFLHGSSASISRLIRPFIRYATFQIDGVPYDGEHIPFHVSASGIELIGEFLRKMPSLKGVAFRLRIMSHTQLIEFNKLFRKTQKWSNPVSLRFLNFVDASGLKAIVRQFRPGTLKAVQIPFWYKTPEYKILQSHCPTLKALHLSAYYGQKLRVLRSMDHEVLDSISGDFTQLESLILRENTSADTCLWSLRWPQHLHQLNQTIERLIVSLNAMPHLRRFAFTLWLKRLDKRFIRQDWTKSRESRRSLEDAELDDWYSTLILRISDAVPRLEELCITSEESDFYRGTRIGGQSSMRVERASFSHVDEKHQFPNALVI